MNRYSSDLFAISKSDVVSLVSKTTQCKVSFKLSIGKFKTMPERWQNIISNKRYDKDAISRRSLHQTVEVWFLTFVLRVVHCQMVNNPQHVELQEHSRCLNEFRT